MKKHFCQRRSAGFTLIEIMVVVVIIGVLAATIIPQFIGTTHDAKVSAAKGHVAELESALERFNVHMDRYPTAEEGSRRWWKRHRPRTRNGAARTSSCCVPIPGEIHTNTGVPAFTTQPASTFGPEAPMALTAARARRGYRELVGMRLIVANHNRRLGFTLVELMVVIVLIGIMTAMIIPEMKGTYEDALLRSTSRELVSVFGVAGSRAVGVNQVLQVRLDRKTGRYAIERRVRDGGRGKPLRPRARCSRRGRKTGHPNFNRNPQTRRRSGGRFWGRSTAGWREQSTGPGA